MSKFLLMSALVAVFALASCKKEVEKEIVIEAEKPSMTPQEFINYANDKIKEAAFELNAAQWVRMTYIIDDTAVLATNAYTRYMELEEALLKQARTYDLSDVDASTKQAFNNMLLGQTLLPPETEKDRKRIAEVNTLMEGAYGAGKYCKGEGENQVCKNLGELSNILRDSRNYDEQLEAWIGWRTVSPAYKDKYVEFVELANKGAQAYGFANLGESWKSGYDMSGDEFEAETERLWGQVKPLYEDLHCYTRNKLSSFYGEDKVSRSEPIPAHLLGNMWSQQWAEIYDLLEPFPGIKPLDVTAALVKKDMDAIEITETAENFFVSLGMQELPESFWEKSMLVKPRDRDVVCHASAWSMDGKTDVRIKQCVEPTAEEFSTMHHELGHIYYDLAYNHHPMIFQGGAHDGFHEAIGDTIALSLTPGYMKTIGLVDSIEENEQAEINHLMKVALDKIAFLPFGKLIDQWRWKVFSGEITPDNYNKAWWELRTRYQGIKAPVVRSEADFDPGAKYHIPGNTPYTRYFLAHIMQFQFHKALCDTAGFDGPLHKCSIYNNKEAGAVLQSLLSKGSSQPWADTLEEAIGTRQMDAAAIAEYFAPLSAWLKEQNQGQSCGW